MDLDDLLVVDHYHAVADSLEEGAQIVGLKLTFGLSAYDDLGTVGELDVVVELGGGAVEALHSERLVFFVFNYFAVLEAAKHTLKDRAKSLAAGVYNACLFEHGEQLGSDGKRVVSLVDDSLPNVNGVGILS